MGILAEIVEEENGRRRDLFLLQEGRAVAVVK